MKKLFSPLLALTAGIAFSLGAAAQTPTVRYAFAGNANDLSGNGRHGTLLGTASIGVATLSIPENATGRVRVPESAVNGLGDFSVTATVTITPVHTTPSPPVQLNTVLSGATAVEDNVVQIAYRNQTGAWQVSLGSPAVGNPTQSFLVPAANRPVTGRWVHIAYVRRTISGVTRGTFYQNGVQVGTPLVLTGAPSIAPLNVAANGLVIGQDQDAVDGGYQAGQSLKGQMGELTIYNGGLTAAQVAALARLTWTGDEDTDFAKVTNWSLLAVPTFTTNAVVPGTTPNQPTLAGVGNTLGLVLESGSALDQLAAGTLELKGSLTNNSFSTSLNGTTIFSGPGGQSLNGTIKTGFANLTVGTSGLTDGGAGASISRVLQLNGSFVIGDAPLVLISTATGTGMVVNNGGVVNGQVAVQRYITPGSAPGLGYRHMSSPVQNTPISDLNFTGFTTVTNPLFNTSPTPQLVVPYPNVFFFNEALSGAQFDRGYRSPASTGSPLTPGVGYSLYMPASTGSASTPDFVGALNNGPINSEPLTNTAGTLQSGWHLIGNPYPAPIDWDQVRAIPGAIPAGMQDGVSVFQTAGLRNGTYLSYNNGVGSLPGGLIASAQGFFVRNTAVGTSPVFQFTNPMRAMTYANPAHYRTAPDPRPLLTLALTSLTDGVMDEAFVYAEAGATLGYDPHFDAGKVSRSLATAPTLAVVAGGQDLAICGLAPALLTTDAGLDLPLRVLTNVPGRHELRAVTLRGLPADLPLWLTDARTGQTVDLRDPAAHLIFEQAPTFAGARFTLRIGGARPAPTAAATSALVVEAYPNPAAAAGALSVTLRGLPTAATTVEATLTDALGRAVRHASVAVREGSAKHELPLAHLPAGAYVLRLVMPATGETVTRAILVQ